MKHVILALSVALSLTANPVAAQSGGEGQIELETLTEDQLDSLVSILSGLPRQ